MTSIQTVTGSVDSSDLGICLSHEHILNDVTSWWHPPFIDSIEAKALAEQKVSVGNLWALRHDPFASRDNCTLDDRDLAVDEVNRFARLGGATIFEATSASIGRDPEGLRYVSEQTGVNIVMGTGLYLDSSQPQGIDEVPAGQLVESMLSDINDGVNGIRAGFIGEIGVGSDFTPRERKSLSAAAIVQAETGLPLQIHLPGWFRLGLEVLDVAEASGADPRSIVLCHMNPSGDDHAYQEAILQRGAWVQYDMIGMDIFYADQSAQCPSDEENARNLLGLISRGWGDQILISCDVFLKTLLRANGGPGYGHILEYFLPRLQRHGATEDQAISLVTNNPRRLFEFAAGK